MNENHSPGLRDAFAEQANAYLEQFRSLPDYCQTWRVLSQLSTRVVDYSLEQGCDSADLEARLREAIFFVDMMKAILNPLTSKYETKEPYKNRLSDSEKAADPETWIWKHRNPRQAFEGGEKSGHYWPVDRDELARVCDEYIRKPWLHCPLIDHLLIDCMVYQEALGFGEKIKPALLGSGITGTILSVTASGFNKGSIKKGILDAAVGLLWMILALAVGLAAADSQGWWVGILAGFGIWLMLKINWQLKHFEKIMLVKTDIELLIEMQSASDMMEKFPLSPAFLKERLSASANKGVAWPVGIFPILENAILRNPAVWS